MVEIFSLQKFQGAIRNVSNAFVTLPSIDPQKKQKQQQKLRFFFFIGRCCLRKLLCLLSKRFSSIKFMPDFS